MLYSYDLTKKAPIYLFNSCFKLIIKTIHIAKNVYFNFVLILVSKTVKQVDFIQNDKHF